MKADQDKTTFFPFDFPCKAASARGKLKHSHLENGYLLLSADRLFDVIEVKKDIPYTETIDLYNQLVDSMVDAYNLTQLVDLLSPLKTLSQVDKNKLKHILNVLYQTEFRPEKRKKNLMSVGSIFISALNAFLKTRKNKTTVVSESASYNNLHSAATALRDTLDKLPKGIWMP